ncbi:MAG: hypothetical protein EPN57_10600 [Paraburkholderia sp.]|nr:MAG: hypothetical protein EPN57_10600 [Paraburkholderia sp.]
MSILKNILTGNAGIKAATNVHLAEIALPGLSNQDKQKIKDQMIKMWTRSSGESIESRIRSFNAYDRLTQLSYIAIAMSLAGIESPVSGEIWNNIRYPGANLPDRSDLAVNAEWLKKKRGIDVSIKIESLDITYW